MRKIVSRRCLPEMLDTLHATKNGIQCLTQGLMSAMREVSSQDRSVLTMPGQYIDEVMLREKIYVRLHSGAEVKQVIDSLCFVFVKWRAGCEDLRSSCCRTSKTAALRMCSALWQNSM